MHWTTKPVTAPKGVNLRDIEFLSWRQPSQPLPHGLELKQLSGVLQKEKGNRPGERKGTPGPTATLPHGRPR